MILPRHITLFGRLVDLANIDCGGFSVNVTVWLSYAYILSGALFAMGWWPCAGCGGCDWAVNKCCVCADNVDLNGLALDYTFDGIANSVCTTCPNVEDTFQLTFNVKYPGYGCSDTGFHNVCRTGNGFTATWTKPAADYILDVELRFTLLSPTRITTFNFQKNFGATPPDCTAWVNEDIPYINEGGNGGNVCDPDTPTLKLTSA